MEPPTTNGTDATTLNIPVTNGHSKMSQDNDSDYIPSVNSIPEKTAGDETSKNKLKGCLGENLLTVATLIGVLAGIGLGFGLKSAREWSKREVMYVSFPGELFLNMLKCLILPLIISSLVQAVGSLDTKLTGKIGFRAVAYYMLTTLSAIILGIILVVSIRPGAGGSVSIQDAVEQRPALIEDTLMDLVRNMFPPNILQACLNQYSTILIKPGNMTNDTENLREWDWEGKMVGQTNILGVVVAAVVLGITLGKMGKKGKPLLDLFSSLGEAIMIITRCVIWLSPLGVLFLVASKIMEMEDLALIAGQVGMYSVTVLAGILIHGFIVLPLIYFILTRKNPLTFMIRMGQALATAFGTASR
ncbi:Excitatory amino acid transporter 1, partial [Stegodyphus mimosarum]